MDSSCMTLAYSNLTSMVMAHIIIKTGIPPERINANVAIYKNSSMAQ